MNYIRVLLIFLSGYPHLNYISIGLSLIEWGLLAFLKVLKPARIDPPIQVEYFRSGGA